MDQAKEATLLPVTNISNTESVETESERMHTMEFLKGRKQVRCIWCTCIHLIEKKITLMCFECNKGFYINHCWSHHVTHGGIPAAPKYGTKREGGVSEE